MTDTCKRALQYVLQPAVFTTRSNRPRPQLEIDGQPLADEYSSRQIQSESEVPRSLADKKRNAGAVKVLLQKLGPGLITGASDDDPSGIGTYSQVGTQFGYGLLWTMVLTYPLMTAIQEISARIGRVTGIGIAANLRKNYPKPVLYCVLIVVSVANVFNLGADIGPWQRRRIWYCRERSECSLYFLVSRRWPECCWFRTQRMPNT